MNYIVTIRDLAHPEEGPWQSVYTDPAKASARYERERNRPSVLLGRLAVTLETVQS